MQIENRQQLLTVFTIAAIALFAGDKLVFSPLKKLWSSRATEITQLHSQISQGKSLIEREQSIRRRWDMIRRNALPNNQSATEQEVVRAINQWAQESRATVTAITPLWKHDDVDYMTLQCRVDARATSQP